MITPGFNGLNGMHMLKKIAILLAVFLPCSMALAATPVHEFELDNGLKLFVKEDHRAPVVISQVWYKVGSSYEPMGITGISHALEHMMFKGTAKHPTGEFDRLIVENGGQENAGTSRDFTYYYQLLSADKLPLSFELEADRMANLILTEDEFKKEIEVVKEERHMRTENNPNAKTFERFAAAAYLAIPYHNPTVGWQSDLDQMQIEDLRKWYNTWYAPNNAMLVVVGDVDPKEVYALAKHHFADVKAKPIPETKKIKAVTGLGRQVVTVNAPAQVPLILLGFKTPSLNTAADQSEPYALNVLANILSGGESARLDKSLVRKQQIAHEVGIGYDLYSRFAALFMISSVPAEGHNVEQIEAGIMKQIKILQEQLVDPKELERIKTQVIANKIYAQDSIAHQAELIGSLESVGLSWKEIENYPKQIKKVTAEQVRDVARKYLTTENLTVAILQPKALPNNQQATEN